jgi:hypothetical protein
MKTNIVHFFGWIFNGQSFISILFFKVETLKVLKGRARAEEASKVVKIVTDKAHVVGQKRFLQLCLLLLHALALSKLSMCGRLEGSGISRRQYSLAVMAANEGHFG